MEYGESLAWLEDDGTSLPDDGERKDDLGGSSSGGPLHPAVPFIEPLELADSHDKEPFLTEGADGIGVEGARLPRCVCEQLSIHSTLDLRLALSALEDDVLQLCGSVVC